MQRRNTFLESEGSNLIPYKLPLYFCYWRMEREGSHRKKENRDFRWSSFSSYFLLYLLPQNRDTDTIIYANLDMLSLRVFEQTILSLSLPPSLSLLIFWRHLLFWWLICCSCASSMSWMNWLLLIPSFCATQAASIDPKGDWKRHRKSFGPK